MLPYSKISRVQAQVALTDRFVSHFYHKKQTSKFGDRSCCCAGAPNLKSFYRWFYDIFSLEISWNYFTARLDYVIAGLVITEFYPRFDQSTTKIATQKCTWMLEWIQSISLKNGVLWQSPSISSRHRSLVNLRQKGSQPQNMSCLH